MKAKDINAGSVGGVCPRVWEDVVVARRIDVARNLRRRCGVKDVSDLSPISRLAAFGIVGTWYLDGL